MHLGFCNLGPLLPLLLLLPAAAAPWQLQTGCGWLPTPDVLLLELPLLWLSDQAAVAAWLLLLLLLLLRAG
jgi:hypothetical protein